MSDLIVEEWRKWGMNRLYVDRPDGPRVGFMDLDTGEINADNPDHMDEMVERIERWKAQNPDAVARWGLPGARRDARRPAVATWGVRSVAERTPGATNGTAATSSHDAASCSCARLKMTYWDGDGAPKLMIRDLDRSLIGHWDLVSNAAHPKNPADRAIIEHAYEIWSTRHAVAASPVTGEAEASASGQGDDTTLGTRSAARDLGGDSRPSTGMAAGVPGADGAKRKRGLRIRSVFRRRGRSPAP